MAESTESVGQRRNPKAKRSPSILVTDSRHYPTPNSRSSVPYANSNGISNTRQYRLRSSSEQSKFSNISVSNVLSNASEIPSAVRRRGLRDNERLPMFNTYNNPRNTHLLPPASSYGTNINNNNSSSRSNNNNANINNTNSRSFKRSVARRNAEIINIAPKRKLNQPKMTQSLPPRTSKTSQKLVYIPDNREEEEDDDGEDDRPSSSLHDKSQKNLKKAKAEIKKTVKNPGTLSRVTAYLISDTLDLTKASQFLKKNHKVSPRLYDEVLYVPYQLPLLAGKDGYRVRSNDYTKNSVGRAKVDDFLDKTEQKDYHFEYFSGQENEELLKNEINDEDDALANEEIIEGNSENNITSTDGGNNEDNNYASDFKNNEEDNFDPSEPQYFNYKEPEISFTLMNENDHAEVFLFNYGVIVFWNFTKLQEENILADLSFSDILVFHNTSTLTASTNWVPIESEEFHFEYDKTTNVPRIYNDMITLKSQDHLVKMTISHAIAQSTKLCRFETRISEVLYSVTKLPKILALTGQIGITREQLLKKSGKLFKLRVDVNLSSNILDTPEFFWSFEPSLNPLYTAARDYLEIDERVGVINDRCKVFLEFIDMIAESIAENNMSRITWMIIVMLLIKVLVSITPLILIHFT